MTYDEWLADVPQQFVNKTNFNILLMAFSKQLDEIYSTLKDIDDLTDVNTATGKNLDYIGSILSMTRKQAAVILRSTEDELLDDERYRKVLQYKAIKNVSDGTYADIMESTISLWGANNILFEEPKNRPATFLLKLSNVDIDDVDPAENSVLAIHAAGIQASYTYSLHHKTRLNTEKVVNKSLGINTKVNNAAIKAKISNMVAFSFANKTETTLGKVLITREARFLNGEYLMDGEILMDGAIYREEII